MEGELVGYSHGGVKSHFHLKATSFTFTPQSLKKIGYNLHIHEQLTKLITSAFISAYSFINNIVVLDANSCLTLGLQECSQPGSLLHGVSRQEHWPELPFPSLGNLLSRVELSLLHWQVVSSAELLESL